MSVGLIALLDDVAALAKVAAASLDDVASQAMKAGAKAAGVVIDDAAVTPRYVVGFAAARELPIIWRIALGSMKNKLLILTPVALLLSYFAPWTINPLLMIGGAFLCYEGAEKLYEAFFPHHAHEHEAATESVALDAQTLEDEKIASAIKTDFILSAEIMAITLAALPGGSFWAQAASLVIVALGITVIVYGAVALIVKADDFGVWLAREGIGGATRALGRGIVKAMPVLLALLAIIGTAAMIWVGGGIIVHGLEVFGLAGLAHFIHGAATSVAGMAPSAKGFVEWLVGAIGSGIVGLALGALLIPISSMVIAPAWRAVKRLIGKPVRSESSP
jgi:predicted DNA repair protein MutK